MEVTHKNEVPLFSCLNISSSLRSLALVAALGACAKQNEEPVSQVSPMQGVAHDVLSAIDSVPREKWEVNFRDKIGSLSARIPFQFRGKEHALEISTGYSFNGVTVGPEKDPYVFDVDLSTAVDNIDLDIWAPLEAQQIAERIWEVLKPEALVHQNEVIAEAPLQEALKAARVELRQQILQGTVTFTEDKAEVKIGSVTAQVSKKLVNELFELPVHQYIAEWKVTLGQRELSSGPEYVVTDNIDFEIAPRLRGALLNTPLPEWEFNPTGSSMRFDVTLPVSGHNLTLMSADWHDVNRDRAIIRNYPRRYELSAELAKELCSIADSRLAPEREAAQLKFNQLMAGIDDRIITDSSLEWNIVHQTIDQSYSATASYTLTSSIDGVTVKLVREGNGILLDRNMVEYGLGAKFSSYGKEFSVSRKIEVGGQLAQFIEDSVTTERLAQR